MRRVPVNHERSCMVVWRRQRRDCVISVEQVVVEESAQVTEELVLLEVSPEIAADKVFGQQVRKHGLQV